MTYFGLPWYELQRLLASSEMANRLSCLSKFFFRSSFTDQRTTGDNRPMRSSSFNITQGLGLLLINALLVSDLIVWHAASVDGAPFEMSGARTIRTLCHACGAGEIRFDQPVLADRLAIRHARPRYIGSLT
jgi:hypothetical protein